MAQAGADAADDMDSYGAGDAGDGMAEPPRPSTPPKTADEGRQALGATAASMLGLKTPVYNPNGAYHHTLLHGSYALKMADPSRVLVFYTYRQDHEEAEVQSSEVDTVPFTVS